MRRNFGLKAMSMAERSGSIRLHGEMPVPAVAPVASPNLSPEDTPEATPASQASPLALPFAPASWRGCHGRRSVSVE